MRQSVVAVGQSMPRQGFGAGRPQAGISWRHVATVLLLMIVLPVFLVAGAAALLAVPVVLTVVGIEQIRQLARSRQQPASIRTPR
jgi:hypothetical protein